MGKVFSIGRSRDDLLIFSFLGFSVIIFRKVRYVSKGRYND